MKYKILISDYDDTLIDDNGNLPENNRKAIERFQNAGGIFAINTGRMINSILPIAKKLNLSGYLGSYQGGVISDLDSGEIIRDVRLSVSDTITQLEELEKLNAKHLHLYDGTKLYAVSNDEELKKYETLSGIRATLVGGTLSNYARENNISANKLMMIANNEEVTAVMNLLKAKYPNMVYVLSKPIFLEILSPLGTKGAFVKFMAEKFSVPTSQIVAVGDSLNDCDMIKTAGLGLAVANSHAELLSMADVALTSSNNDGAICEIIDKYIMA